MAPLIPEVPSPVTPRLISAKRASLESGIPYGSLRDLAFRGEIPVIRIGRAWYFERADVERWIRSKKEIVGR